MIEILSRETWHATDRAIDANEVYRVTDLYAAGLLYPNMQHEHRQLGTLPDGPRAAAFCAPTTSLWDGWHLKAFEYDLDIPVHAEQFAALREWDPGVACTTVENARGHMQRKISEYFVFRSPTGIEHPSDASQLAPGGWQLFKGEIVVPEPFVPGPPVIGDGQGAPLPDPPVSPVGETAYSGEFDNPLASMLAARDEYVETIASLRSLGVSASILEGVTEDLALKLGRTLLGLTP